MRKTLGETLKFGREGQNWTLRDVEDATGISNAYLSQLENDKIKKPSANVLYKLSVLYGVALESLLEAAGIVQLFQQRTKTKKVVKTVGGFTVTDEEEGKLVEYLGWMRHQNKKSLKPSKQ